VVWLRADPVAAAARLQADHRGLAVRPALTAAGTIAELAGVLETRAPLYQAVADLVVDTDGRTPDRVADAIIDLWPSLVPGFFVRCPLGRNRRSRRESRRAHDVADTADAGNRAVRDRYGRGELPERLHLPAPLAEERDLAGVALPSVLPCNRGPGQRADRR